MFCYFLAAKSDDLNVDREYVCNVDQDLFGYTIIETRWGRAGCRKQSMKRSFQDRAEALKYWREVYSRRRTLKKRVGVAYDLVDLSVT